MMVILLLIDSQMNECTHFYVIIDSQMNECIHFYVLIDSQMNECIHFYVLIDSLMNECSPYYVIIDSLMNECIHYYVIIDSLMNECTHYYVLIDSLMNECTHYYVLIELLFTDTDITWISRFEIHPPPSWMNVLPSMLYVDCRLGWLILINKSSIRTSYLSSYFWCFLSKKICISDRCIIHPLNEINFLIEYLLRGFIDHVIIAIIEHDIFMQIGC